MNNEMITDISSRMMKGVTVVNPASAGRKLCPRKHGATNREELGGDIKVVLLNSSILRDHTGLLPPHVS